MRKPTPAHLLIIAAAIAIGLAYLAGGALGVGAADRDYVFSPADDPRTQVGVSAADVPIAGPPTASAVAARASLAVALGRRSALRDFAAVSAAVTVAAFAAVLLGAGLPLLPVMAAMLGLAFGATMWSRAIAFPPDALAPALAVLSVWLAQRWRVKGRRSMAVLAIVTAVLAIVDSVVPLIARQAGDTPQRTIAVLTSEFSALGLFLVVVGLAVLLRDPHRRLTIGLFVFGVAGWQLWFGSSIDPVTFPIALAGWAAVAIGLSWMQRAMPQRAGHALLAVVAVMLVAVPALTRARLSVLGRDLPSQQRVRMANEFRVTELPDGAMVIAESRRADATILLSSIQAGKPVTFVAQSPETVIEAIATGKPIFAFENARDHLEQHGFLFERTFVGNVEVATVAGHVPCVPLNADTFADVSLLLANGAFVIHGKPETAPAGVVIRVASQTPPEIAAIEPRSIPFELGPIAADAEGVPDLLKLTTRAGAGSIASIRIPATGRVAPVTMTFRSAPAYAVATAEDSGAASMCARAARSGVALGAGATAATSLRMNDHAPFGSGWHPVEADPDLFRWTAAPDASVRITAAKPTPVRVTITATPASRPAQKPSIGLTVNNCRLEMKSMQAGQGDYEWEVDERCWLPGVNQLWIHTSPLISPASLFATHDTRLLGSRIGAIRFARR